MKIAHYRAIIAASGGPHQTTADRRIDIALCHVLLNSGANIKNVGVYGYTHTQPDHDMLLVLQDIRTTTFVALCDVAAIQLIGGQ